MFTFCRSPFLVKTEESRVERNARKIANKLKVPSSWSKQRTLSFLVALILQMGYLSLDKRKISLLLQKNEGQ